VRNPEVAKISFTGSLAVGERIMRDGAATLKRVTLELGGKSPHILLDDTDLKNALPRALGIALIAEQRSSVRRRNTASGAEDCSRVWQAPYLSNKICEQGRSIVPSPRESQRQRHIQIDHG
jgi:hypothetical protein